MKFEEGSGLSPCLYFLISYDSKKLFVIKLLKAKHQLAFFISTKMNKFSIETSSVLYCQFYWSNFDVTKCGSAYIWSHEKWSCTVPNFIVLNMVTLQ